MTRTARPTLLVAGGARVDAGKTTFSTGLLSHLANRYGDAIGVKPRAGNDYWFDHDDYRVATDAGRLYGKDARRLSAASTRPLHPDAEAITPEAINPVHRLWRPTPERTGMLGETDRTFLCDRVTTPEGSRFVVNGSAETAKLLPDGLIDRLPLAEARHVADIREFNEEMASTYVPAFDRFADSVATADAPIAVESYADVAVPLDVDVDAVAVVEPGRARIYAGDRYQKARAVASGSAREGSMEEHTDTVTEMIEPLATTELPALSGAERGDPDRVRKRYVDAYEELLDAGDDARKRS